MVADGRQVSYVGPADRTLAVGDQGQVLSGTVDSAHVMFTTGACRGQVLLIHTADLEEISRREPGLLDDTLDIPNQRVAVREVYESQGESGLLSALAETGALAGLTDIAEDLLGVAAARVREDGLLAPVLAQLEPDEADAVVGLAALACVREALGE